VSHNARTCARAHRAHCERWIAAGNWKAALAACVEYQKMAGHVRSSFAFLKNDETTALAKELEADTEFYDALIREFGMRSNRPMLERMELPREKWHPRMMSDEELQGRVVLVCYGRMAGETHYQKGPNAKQPDQCEGMPLSTDSNLELWQTRYADVKLTLIGLVDDDRDSSSQDSWRPEPPPCLLELIKQKRPNHPVVYSYRSKFVDAMFQGMQSRALLFDATGKLRRVYARFPEECTFEPVDQEFRKLLAE
jgi:hypothetical protein